MTCTDRELWASVLGSDLELAEAQPRQIVRVNRNGKVELIKPTLRVLGLSEGDSVRITPRDGWCLLEKVSRGGRRVTKGRVPVSEQAAGIISGTVTVLVAGAGEARLLPVKVQAHSPDVLGPRFVDELKDKCIVRHAVPGLPVHDWSDGSVAELVSLLCAEPFAVDPVEALAEGSDWVAWMTRNRILGRPAPEDGDLRDQLTAEVLDGHSDDGSWGSVVDTAYGILNLLALDMPPTDRRVRRAAKWLLAVPEPAPRPGMWMLDQELMEQWLALRQPSGSPPAQSCPIQWHGPGRNSFYARQRVPDEVEPFLRESAQRIVPNINFGGGACEPRMTHVSALAAEALMRCGHAGHPRVRRYLNTVRRVGGVGGYWCGCGVLGLRDADLPACEGEPDLDRRIGEPEHAADQSPWVWFPDVEDAAGLANQPCQPFKGRRPESQGVGTRLEPFVWRKLPGRQRSFALIGTAWQNAECSAKTNRALAAHPACHGSLTERLALYQMARYQTSLGDWPHANPHGMLAFLSLYDHPAAKALAAKTIPWLRRHQDDDGLWRRGQIARLTKTRASQPVEPRLVTYHIVLALHRLGLLPL